MPRPEKVAAVAEIKERIESAKAVFLAEYAGLSVKQQQELRRGLKAQGAEFKVVKMTLARRAAGELEIDAFDELLLGPTGIAFADEDAVSAAKVLKDFSRANDVFKVKGGLLGRDPLTPERIDELAEIEPRDVLLAKLAGAMKAPLTNMASLLAALPRSVATMVQQLVDKQVDAGETAEPAPAADGDAAAPADDEAETPPAAAADAAPDDETEAEASVDAEPEASGEAEAKAPAEVEAASESTDEASGDEETPEDEVTEAAAETVAEEEPEAVDEAPEADEDEPAGEEE